MQNYLAPNVMKKKASKTRLFCPLITILVLFPRASRTNYLKFLRNVNRSVMETNDDRTFINGFKPVHVEAYQIFVLDNVFAIFGTLVFQDFVLNAQTKKPVALN